MTNKNFFTAIRAMAASMFQLTLLLALTGVSVRAHDPMDITAQARFLPGGIELRLTLAWSTACQLIAKGREPASFQPEKFAEIRPLFQQHAAGFLPVTVEGKILAPQTVAAELNYDGDVKIILQFSSPTAPRVRFDAALLKSLPEDCTVFLLIRGPGPKQYVQERMTFEKPSYEIDGLPH